MQTCNIMGVNIAVTDMDKTLRLVEDNCEAWRGKYICVANVHTTVTAHDDPTYLRVQNGAVMALPDGGPLSRYSRKKGFADAARVTGPDLMRELLKESGTKHYRHYFYGSTQETLDILREKIDERAAAAAPAILILDFSAVTFMDSSGIGLILGRHKLVSAMGGVVVVQKAPKDIKRMLSIAGIESKD